MTTGTENNSPGRGKKDSKIVIAAFAIAFVMVFSIPFLFGNDNGNGDHDGYENILGASTDAMVAAGREYSVALKDDGTVWAWGRNDFGQLGNGTNTDSGVPVQVSGLTGVTAIAAGYDYSMALKDDGTVWTWGFNDYGQLGDGTDGAGGSGVYSDVPVQVLGPGGIGFLEDVTAIAAGNEHSAALKNDGTMWTWGRNNYGQLGDGTSGVSAGKNTPVQVQGAGGIGYLTDVKAIAIGNYHSTALKDDGTVWAWGYNFNGQLGNGTRGTGTDKSTPVQVLGPGSIGFLEDVTAIAAGDAHSIVLKNDGTVWAWGYNFNGQLGDGTSGASARKSTPVQVLGPGGIGFLEDVTAIAAGYEHSIALNGDGAVWAWGYNGNGRLGDNTLTSSSTPVQVHGPGNAGLLEEVTAIAAGYSHSVAVLKDDGTVWIWGYNNHGQLGDGTTTSSRTPVQVFEAGGDEFSLLVPEPETGDGDGDGNSNGNNNGNSNGNSSGSSSSTGGGGDDGGDDTLLMIIIIVIAAVVITGVYLFINRKR